MKPALHIIGIWAALSLMMALLKTLFMLWVGGYAAADGFAVIWHGLPMDMSMAGYLTVIPALIAIAAIWVRKKWLGSVIRGYFLVISVLLAVITVADAMLYPYWGFKIDSTPVFYVLSSPSAAAASVRWWEWIVAGVATAAVAAALFFVCTEVWRFIDAKVTASSRRWVATAVGVLTMALLFLPIRGSVTVSTMNPSRAYFSNEQRLNHAAITPAFNLMYSFAHLEDFSRFHFLDDADAAGMMHSFGYGRAGFAPQDSVTARPDIHLIILESFSSHLLPSAGGDSIAMRLDSIAGEGWLWPNTYASSFRTDRGLPAILAAYPAPPTTSLSNDVSRYDNIPSLPRLLKANGYDMAYYYGGDINFNSFTALVRAAGYDRIVSDKDFPVGLRLSKWGAHDEHVYARVLADTRVLPADQKPHLTTIQTSSSHEPFEVPFRKSPNDRINAFEYADSCLGAYIDSLRAMPSWANTLVVIVPDHYGVYPHPEDFRQRFRIPLVFAGGWLDNFAKPEQEILDATASQTDMAATVLAILGIRADSLVFSRNLLDPRRPHIAFFSNPDMMGVATDSVSAYVSVATIKPSDGSPDSLATAIKAFYQSLYSDFSSR